MSRIDRLKPLADAVGLSAVMRALIHNLRHDGVGSEKAKEIQVESNLTKMNSREHGAGSR
jgi:hypothetical protein